MITEMFERARKTRLADCQVLLFAEADAGKGPLVSIEALEDLPFSIRRVYHFKRGKEDIARGDHANFENQQLILAVQGSFEVALMDGFGHRTVKLGRADQGLLIREGIWRTVQYFSQDAIGLVLCSHPYLREDYLEDFQAYLAWKRRGFEQIG